VKFLGSYRSISFIGSTEGYMGQRMALNRQLITQLSVQMGMLIGP